MRSGRPCGDKLRKLVARPRIPAEDGDEASSGGPFLELGIGAFVDEEGGYTSVAVALALLVSLSLAFSLATAGWVQNRSADVQVTADAAALAGANVVGSYVTVATVLDACVLTFGIAGMVTMGAGLVVSAVPGLAGAGASTVKAGLKVLDARQRFATSAAKGLRSLEKTLPLAIVTRSYAVANANETESIGYVGCAIPFPQTSETDFSALDAEVDSEELADVSDHLQEASEKAREARERADDAKREGWIADCGGEPRSMRERAGALAGLSGASNPDYPSPETWTFGAALMRARAYYAARLASEAPDGQTPDALTDSACRRAFYEYALAEVRAGSYTEHADGRVTVRLPSLPKNTSDMRATRLYTDSRWPCSSEALGRTLHADVSCPGAEGPAAGTASLSELDSSFVRTCDACQMDATDLGRVASASTSVDNGFEHHWRRLVEASQAYERAAEELVEAEGTLRDVADEGADAFDDALSSLSVPRPKLCPPGAWGCVAVVARGSGTTTPEELASTYVDSARLPAGAAVSAATLAPDDDAQGNDSLSRLFETMSSRLGAGGAGVLGSIGRLWGGLLVGYGAAADGLSSAADQAVSALEGVPGGSAASWLRDRVRDVIRAAGFEPADLRLRKPVLTNTQNVLDKVGLESLGTARELVGKLPDSGDPAELARALGQEVVNELGEASFTVAELPIPGTDLTVPLTLNVGDLLGVAS